MTTVRIIKKYPNRRLYDTAISSYITLQDIRQLVTENVNFQVVDAKTEEDLTSSTLLQIIIEQEGHQSPLFSRQILENFIRFYGNSMQSMVSHYLQQSMDLFLQQQNKFHGGFGSLLEGNPLQYFGEMANQNLKAWQTMQEQFMQGITPGAPTSEHQAAGNTNAKQNADSDKS